MRLPGRIRLPLREVVKRLYERQDKDEVSDVAAQLSYYFLFSLFPFLVFVATMVAYLPLQSALQRAFDQIRFFLPSDMRVLVQDHLKGLMETRPKLLTIGLLITMWSASRGVDALRRGLNTAYRVTDHRSYWRTQMLSVVFTIVGAIALLGSIAILLAGGSFGYWAATKLGVDRAYLGALTIVRWPITIGLVFFGVAVGYWVIPDVKHPFKFITPGSILTTVGWAAGSLGFGYYASNIGSYNVTYGSIGGVMVVLTWMYLLGFVFLLGGELNAIGEEQARAEGALPPAPERKNANPI